MKTEVIYNEFGSGAFKGLKTQLFKSLIANSRHVQAGLESVADLFSRILGERVNVRQSLHLIHAQLAFSALILFGGISAVVAVLLMCWFVLSVIQCVHAL